MEKLLFYYHTNGTHNSFILPFIYYAAIHNPNSAFEININDQIPNYIDHGVKLLSKQFNNKILITNNNYNGTKPSFSRFLFQPTIKSEYTYIGDIDIMICEDILDFHVNNLQNEKYIFDNHDRSYIGQKERLSGLHFVNSEQYYNKTNNVRLMFINNILSCISDEVMLYVICKLSGLKFHDSVDDPKLFNKVRLSHGMHISLNRRPFDPNSKIEVKAETKYLDKYIQTNNQILFKQLLQTNKTTFDIINKFNKYCKIPC